MGIAGGYILQGLQKFSVKLEEKSWVSGEEINVEYPFRIDIVFSL